MSIDAPIRLESDDIAVEILPFGATLARFEVREADGAWRNIVLGLPTPEAYLTDPSFMGVSVGRYANRIANARFTLDGLEHRLEANEGPNCLHGGSGGYQARVWEVDALGAGHLALGLVSPDGDQGFPGELRVTAEFSVLENGAQVVYTAVTDAPTVVNLTTHPYFNLDGDGVGNTDLHRLVIKANAYTPTRADGIPTGEVRLVSGTAADFRLGQLLGDARVAAVAQGIDRNGGFDHNFVVDGIGLREHAVLTGSSGLTLRVVSDQPGLQVYGGDHFDGTVIGVSGRPYQARAGVALETQQLPDAPNQPGFPSTVLRPGAVFTATTQWLVSWA